MEFTKEQIDDMFDRLALAHPNAECELNFNSTFELLVAVILSAQCTDKRVNEVTKDLFAKYNTPQDFADIKQEELEKLIFSCGFYRSKAAHIISCARDIVERFGGKVPETLTAFSLWRAWAERRLTSSAPWRSESRLCPWTRTYCALPTG